MIREQNIIIILLSSRRPAVQLVTTCGVHLLPRGVKCGGCFICTVLPVGNFHPLTAGLRSEWTNVLEKKRNLGKSRCTSIYHPREPESWPTTYVAVAVADCTCVRGVFCVSVRHGSDGTRRSAAVPASCDRRVMKIQTQKLRFDCHVRGIYPTTN